MQYSYCQDVIPCSLVHERSRVNAFDRCYSLHCGITLPATRWSGGLEEAADHTPLTGTEHAGHSATWRRVRSIQPSAWKGCSEKSGCLIGAGLIHIPGSLCTTTTCSPPRLSRGAPEAVLAAFGRRYTQDPGCELRRITLPRTP